MNSCFIILLFWAFLYLTFQGKEMRIYFNTMLTGFRCYTCFSQRFPCFFLFWFFSLCCSAASWCCCTARGKRSRCLFGGSRRCSCCCFITLLHKTNAHSCRQLLSTCSGTLWQPPCHHFSISPVHEEHGKRRESWQQCAPLARTRFLLALRAGLINTTTLLRATKGIPIAQAQYSVFRLRLRLSSKIQPKDLAMDRPRPLLPAASHPLHPAHASAVHTPNSAASISGTKLFS